jgi:hypothetical protein
MICLPSVLYGFGYTHKIGRLRKETNIRQMNRSDLDPQGWGSEVWW